MTCYKVVMNFENRLYSSTVAASTMRDWVEYKQGRWTTAPFGGILVFDTLDNALRYCRHNIEYSLEIWKCEVKGAVTLPYGAAAHPVHNICVWKNLPCDTIPWPYGTLAFKKVKLLEKVA